MKKTLSKIVDIILAILLLPVAILALITQYSIPLVMAIVMILIAILSAILGQYVSSFMALLIGLSFYYCYMNE